MSVENSQDKWFVVAGYTGEVLNRENIAFHPVKAFNQREAMDIVEFSIEDFTSSTAISEDMLKAHLKVIEDARERESDNE